MRTRRRLLHSNEAHGFSAEHANSSLIFRKLAPSQTTRNRRMGCMRRKSRMYLSVFKSLRTEQLHGIRSGASWIFMIMFQGFVKRLQPFHGVFQHSFVKRKRLVCPNRNGIVQNSITLNCYRAVISYSMPLSPARLRPFINWSAEHNAIWVMHGKASPEIFHSV